MTADPAHLDPAPDGPLGAARRALTVERQRTTDERDALASFLERVRNVDVVEPTPVQGPRRKIQTPQTTGVATVRDAYVETVMSVPHYDEEYGDSYVESLEAEFGADVAAALVQGHFGEYCKQSVLAKTEQALDERERFLSTLDAERESLADTEERIHTILDRVEGTVDDEDGKPSFSALEGRRSTLQNLQAECDEVAADRQAAIRRQHRQLWVPRSAPDVPAYVYQGLDETYPVLSTIADLGECITNRRRTVERRMSEAK
ncbi:hypothetical protein SAMN05216559_0831 [Halomicrobium zhouii]|uniref:DUF7260 domain-containing protein n=1 Tax=Halomicrobium zhouii TaxID=767519 RepID=A0A1I6KIP5_9EURY|nr:hypothetical protein [Halomicrobium zhouii]SFR90750.1 hypothetical protein SAMN05216559_0831 [Halomicrobium zhouii]